MVSLLGNPVKRISHSGKGMIRKARVIGNALDAPDPQNKDQKAFVGGCWSDSENEVEDKTNDETYIMAQSSNERHMVYDAVASSNLLGFLLRRLCSDAVVRILTPSLVRYDNVKKLVSWLNRQMSLFSTYKAYDEGNVVFGSNLKGKIIGKGTVSNDPLTISNVEHIDNLAFNLLSVDQICDNKCKVLFMKDGSAIIKDDKIIGKGIRKNGLYVMKLGNKSQDKLCLAMVVDNSTLCHRRLGHANMRLIQSLSSKELVRNLPKLKYDKHLCDACKIGKQTHASHKAKNMVSTNRCLELLHMDLFGPSAIKSYRVEESLNVTFDESPPSTKLSPLVDDDVDEEEAIENNTKVVNNNNIDYESIEVEEIDKFKES
ncbi:retrovirus-related pol polyprotein from transposon TNT 1-94 [Tanacetum coccineum]